jgi:hypothetical protein
LVACEEKTAADSSVDELPADPVPETVEPATDSDGDGYAFEDDCDDENADIHPGQTELCDGVDDNCNGQIDEGHADTDADGTADCLDVEECDGLDNDGDGLIDEEFTDTDGDGTADCEDVEECNGIDDDGDGLIDEGFDVDGDGYSPCAIDETADCDDDDASIFPGAEEIDDDATDNDCDGAVDEMSWAEGDLILTEVFNNSTEVTDNAGEWFEIYNNSGEDRILNGLVIRDETGDLHQIADDALIWLADAAYMVLAISDDPSNNGGVVVDYAYEGVSLSNESDSLILEFDGLMIDHIAWDDGETMPDVSGSSMVLDILYFDATLNDLAEGWCDSSWSGSDNSTGSSTPGAPNELCASIDHDDDGYSLLEGDCDDENDRVSPGEAEVPYDGVNNDCDESTLDDDLDGDGFLLADDCDDTDPAAAPNLDEICDGIDNDCDGLSDDDDSSVTDQERWFPDLDGDGYGDSNATPVLYCSAPSGLVSDDQDCDDSSADYNPGIFEDDCDDPEDYNCDGQPAYVDQDLDGFSVCDNDCDDSDAQIFPYGWEDTSDGIDNDCDGEIDTDDSDSVRVLSLGDDDYTSIALSAGFPFCSTTWSTAYVSSNGRITFGSGSTDYSYSASSMATTTSIAGVWDDLNPSSQGRVAMVEYEDATGVYFIGVPEYGGTQSVTFSMIMMEDGRVVLSYGDIDTVDGMVGWSCGVPGSSSESDLTDEAADIPTASLGIGQGTESMVYEIFTSLADANDLASQTFTFCVNSGTDSDGDDWTDDCGDPDDSDSSLTP